MTIRHMTLEISTENVSRYSNMHTFLDTAITKLLLFRLFDYNNIVKVIFSEELIKRSKLTIQSTEMEIYRTEQKRITHNTFTDFIVLTSTDDLNKVMFNTDGCILKTSLDSSESTRLIITFIDGNDNKYYLIDNMKKVFLTRYHDCIDIYNLCNKYSDRIWALKDFPMYSMFYNSNLNGFLLSWFFIRSSRDPFELVKYRTLINYELLQIINDSVLNYDSDMLVDSNFYNHPITWSEGRLINNDSETPFFPQLRNTDDSIESLFGRKTVVLSENEFLYTNRELPIHLKILMNNKYVKKYLGSCYTPD